MGARLDDSLAGREATAALREIATSITATDAVVEVMRSEPPLFLRQAFTTTADDQLDRIWTAIVWAMFIQHTTTSTEIEKRRRLTAAITAILNP